MSERLTSARIPLENKVRGPFSSSIADYGRKTRPEMITQLREYAAGLRRMADAIDATPDEEIIVETYRGVHVHRDLEIVTE